MSTPASTTTGALIGGRVHFEQPAQGYRAAIDPVLLASAVKLARGSVLELGAGAGAATLCLAHRQPGLTILAVEIDHDMAALARRNVARNEMTSRVEILVADVADLPVSLSGRFDAVFFNPPFDPAARSSPSPHPDKRRAHAEGAATLGDWIAAAHRALKPRGLVHLIHRADRLADLLAALLPRFGDIETIPLWPRAGEAAKRVIVRAQRDARGPCVLSSGLVLHEASGAFTLAVERVLRAGAAIDDVLGQQGDACSPGSPDA